MSKYEVILFFFEKPPIATGINDNRIVKVALKYNVIADGSAMALKQATKKSEDDPIILKGCWVLVDSAVTKV